MVGCESGNSFTISPQIHDYFFSKNSMIAILAGWPSAFIKFAISFWFSVKKSDFDIPIVILFKELIRFLNNSILQYYDIYLIRQIILDN